MLLKKPLPLKVYISLFSILFIISLQLFCIEMSPLPWFDETFFASIARSLSIDGKLVPGVSASVMNHEPALAYGPVYFVFTALSFKVLGFGIWQFRIVNLLAGFVAVFLALVIKNQIVKAEKLFTRDDIFWYLLLISDIYWNFNLTGGRMDMTALCFVLSAAVCFNQGTKSGKQYFFVLSGVCWGIAFLTTPRIFFIALAFFITVVVMFFNRKLSFVKILLIGLPFFMIYCIWIWECGGINEFIKIYTHNFDNANTADNTVTEYLLGNFFVPTYEIPLLLIFTYCLIYAFRFTPNFFTNYIIGFILLCIGLFYVLIFDAGPYSTFILPLVYIIIIVVKELLPNRGDIRMLLSALLLVNILHFGFKTFQTMMTSRYRNPELINSFIKKHIPAGSHVVGDKIYYYGVVINNSEFQYFDTFGSLETREKKLREEFKFKYLIESEQCHEINREMREYFIAQNHMKPIAKLEIRNNFSIPLIMQNDDKTYACTIYKAED